LESEKMNTNFAINTSKLRGYKNRYKNAFYGVSLILIFAFSIVMAFAPNASAQFQSGYGKNLTRYYPTTSYIAMAPTVIGVNQEATVNTWILPLPVDYNYAAYYLDPTVAATLALP